MSEQIKKLDDFMNALDMPGVHVRLVDKNDLRERYSVRHNGDNAFERTDVAITANFVAVQKYNSKNQQTGTSVITIGNQIGLADRKVMLGKIYTLKIKLQGIVDSERSHNGK